MKKIDIHIHYVNDPDEKLKNKFICYLKEINLGILLGSNFPKELWKRSFSNKNLLNELDKYNNIYWLASYDISWDIKEPILKSNKIIWVKFYTWYYKSYSDYIISYYIEKYLENKKNIFLFHTWYCYIRWKEIKFNPLKLVKYIKKYKKWNFIIAHLWNPYFNETIWLVKKFDNVYLDLSWISEIDDINIIKDFFKYSKKYWFFDKILFWTDFPLFKYNSTIIFLEKVITYKEIEELTNNTYNFLKNNLCFL